MRSAAVLLVGLVAAATAPVAGADIGLHLRSHRVAVGGVLRGDANGGGLAVYAVPAARGPRRVPCHGDGYCEPTTRHAPGPPFVLLGRLPRTADRYAIRRFAFRLPHRLRAGDYRVYVYCPPCGGALIQSGNRLAGEVLHVVEA